MELNLSERQMLVVHPQNPANPDEPKVVPLPIEIYEDIIVSTRLYSPETLRACALVCHLFAQRAQKLLFSYICLIRPTNVFIPAVFIRSCIWASVRFLETLFSFPHFARYVKALIIHIENPRESWDMGRGTTEEQAPSAARVMNHT